MQKIDIKTASKKHSKVLIAESYKNIDKYLPESQIIIIIDKNVFNFYSEFFNNYTCIKIETGEQLKTLDTVGKIVAQLVELNADRSTFIVGVGGGIACDITGFVASIFMRGLRFGFVSTSLLSQVDASVGGKNGVNYEGYKNMLGVFNQPEFVICDTTMLETLPQTEYMCGLAEIIKMALIADSEMFEFMEQNVNAIIQHDAKAIEYLISKSVEHKASIVQRDEHEAGERRKLNFGHTLAHAIERENKTPHGFAVSIGMAFAVEVSEHLKLIDHDTAQRIESLLTRFGLPLQTFAHKGGLAQNIIEDKKKTGEKINFILLKKIGEACEKSMKINEIKTLIYDLC